MNFQEKLKEIRELAGLDENVKSILKQMTGKELVSYEGIDALVAALMEFYNGELKKKATTNHTHSKEQIEEFPVFGTGANEMLEGVKLAETLGIPYGGILNNSNTKTEGTAYYDSTTKKTYKCTVTNTLNYADASKYEAISNNDLLLKFQNLNKWKTIFKGLLKYNENNIFSLGEWKELKITLGESGGYATYHGHIHLTREDLFIYKGGNDGYFILYDLNSTATKFIFKNNGTELHAIGTDNDNDCVVSIKN